MTVYTGPRVEDSWLEVLDPSDRTLMPRMPGTVSWSVEQRAGRAVHGRMTLRMDDLGHGFDWESQAVRFRPWLSCNGREWPLGVFIPQSPTETHDVEGASWEVTCLDKTSLLAARAVASHYNIPAGVNAVASVEELTQFPDIYRHVPARAASTPSELTTRHVLSFDPTEDTWLTLANRLLDAVGYFGLWADGSGQYRMEPYVLPARRAPVWTFAAGEASIHSPRWDRSRDVASVPNRVRVAVRGDGNSRGMTATAINDDPGHPLSTVSRGFIVDAPLEWTEAADDATLQAFAERRLAEQSRAVARLRVDHAPVPLNLHDVVEFAPLRRQGWRASVQAFTVDSAPGSWMRGEWREITDD